MSPSPSTLRAPSPTKRSRANVIHGPIFYPPLIGCSLCLLTLKSWLVRYRWMQCLALAGLLHVSHPPKHEWSYVRFRPLRPLSPSAVCSHGGKMRTWMSDQAFFDPKSGGTSRPVYGEPCAP